MSLEPHNICIKSYTTVVQQLIKIVDEHRTDVYARRARACQHAVITRSVDNMLTGTQQHVDSTLFQNKWGLRKPVLYRDVCDITLMIDRQTEATFFIK